MTKLKNWKECVEALCAGKTLRNERMCLEVSIKESGNLSISREFSDPDEWHIVEPTITITESEMSIILECNFVVGPGAESILGKMGFKK